MLAAVSPHDERTYHRKFGGVFSAVNSTNWKIGSHRIEKGV